MSSGGDLGRRNPQHPFKVSNNLATEGAGKSQQRNRSQQGGPLGRDQRLFLADLMNPNNMIRKIAMQ